MAEHFNQLTPAQAERLALLAEECGEVIQVVGKILRHGYESHHPDDKRETTNREMLAGEIGHVFAAVELLTTPGDLDQWAINASREYKLARVGRWLHHAAPPAPEGTDG